MTAMMAPSTSATPTTSDSPPCATATTTGIGIVESLNLLNLKEHYQIVKELGKGTYGKVVLANCRKTGTKVALKILPKAGTKFKEFQREFHFSYYLSPHANIVDTYNVAFETRSSYVFAQEFAPLGDLFECIPPQVGLAEHQAKNVIKQVASALDFMHSKLLVHRDIKPENVLIFDLEFNKVKLMDFGMTRKETTVIRKMNGSIPYTPPEICEAVRHESVTVSKSCDVWAFGVLLFCMLTGNFPWENAHIRDIYFNEFALWQRRKTTKVPSQWRRFTPRIMRFFRKVLDLKPDKRSSVKEIHKYMADSWISSAPRDLSESNEAAESDSQSDHVDHLSSILQEHGIDTRVDRRLRERRISEWLLST